MLKRFIPLILILFCMLLFGSPGGNILDEGFERDPGYDVLAPAWAEDEGAGSTVDEDNTDVARPTNGGAELLKIQKVSPNFNARTKWNSGVNNVVTYTTFYVQIAAEGLSNNEFVYLSYGIESGFAYTWHFALRQTGAAIHFRFGVYNDGGYQIYDSATINLDTWYRIDVKYDDTGNTWEWRIDTVSQDSDSLINVHYTEVRQLVLGSHTESETLTAYFDLVNMDSTGYVSFGDGETYIPKVIIIR